MLDEFFEQRASYGAIFLRIVLAWRLIYGTLDNILSWERMLEFRDYLDGRGLIFPLVAAVVSVSAQFVCGLLYLVGAYVRYAAMIMVVNFSFALLIAHIGDAFLNAFDALVMLFGSCCLVFLGAGKLSVDHRRLHQIKNAR